MNNEKMSPRMRTYYTLIITVMVLLSGALVTGVMFLLDSLGVDYTLTLPTLITIFIVSCVAGAMISFFIGQRMLAPMRKLSKASKEVAKGNFDVTVSDSSRLDEVQTTFRNFNNMVKELSSTAMLSNEFVSNVSHEFKTPLTAIEGYAMLMQDPTLTPAEHEEYLSKILDNTQRLSTLVGNILMLSKTETKAVAEQFTVFRLDEQLRQAVVALENQWTEKEISFRVELDEVSFRGCERLLPHVWSNLLSNAIKFSPKGSEITLGLLNQKECVVVTVSDQGCGMTKEVQERIFEKFYQGDTTHRSEGNGLGLPLAKRIVELSDGVIEVTSQPEQGTTFRVILPK